LPEISPEFCAVMALNFWPVLRYITLTLGNMQNSPPFCEFDSIPDSSVLFRC